MSALPPKADMSSVEINVCFVPIADIHHKWPVCFQNPAISSAAALELLQRLGHLLGRHGLEHLVAYGLVEFGHRRGIEIAAASALKRRFRRP